MFKATKLNETQLFNLKALIAEVKQHEERTVVLLGDALPLALNHVWGNDNTTMINELIHALSPVNKKAALVFFDAFQPHEYGYTQKDKRVKAFGKRISKAHTHSTRKAMEAFFSLNPETGEVDPANGYFGGDYWLWADTNVKVEAKEVNYLEQVGKAIDYALDEKKGGLSQNDILYYLMDKKGMDLAVFMEMLAIEAEVSKAA